MDPIALGLIGAGWTIIVVLAVWVIAIHQRREPPRDHDIRVIIQLPEPQALPAPAPIAPPMIDPDSGSWIPDPTPTSPRVAVPCVVFADGLWRCVSCPMTSKDRGWGPDHLKICKG